MTRISLLRYGVGFIPDINEISLFQDTSKGEPTELRAQTSLASSPDTVFNSQPRTGVKLITGRQTQFKADFGGKI